MNNFEVLKHYSIPSDVLMDMLDTYKLLGMNNEYLIKIGDKKDVLIKDTLDKDTFFVACLLGLEITENRLRLLITKDSIPKNKQEEAIVGIKKVLTLITRDTTNNLPFNGSDVQDYLNIIFGKGKVSFSKDMFKGKKNIKPISKRLVYEKVLEEYFNFSNNRIFEPIFLSVIAFMEMTNIEPYTNYNEMATYLAMYYMMLYSKVEAFRYVSFFELLYKNLTKIKEEVRLGSLNYTENYLQASGLVRLMFKMIQEAYDDLDVVLKNYAFQSHAFKSDVIEETIYHKVPEFFTKDDVRRYHPDASDSTINRSLFKLRDMGVIMPLGKGRSARWMKIMKEDDPKMLFGVKYENKD